MLSFTYIINNILENKSKIVDYIYRFIEQQQIYSEHISLSVHPNNAKLKYRVHKECDDYQDRAQDLFLNLVDMWVDSAENIKKDDIEAEIDHTIKHLQQIINTNPHI